MRAILRFLWRALKVFHTVAASIVLIILFVALANVMAQRPLPTVPEGAALVLNPAGVIVEQTRPPELEEILAEQIPQEILLRDLQEAIERAKDDDRITALVLDLDRLVGGGAGALHALGRTIADFKQGGKKVIAMGDAYSQAQYLLAARADTIWMNPFGSVLITGYGTYPLYFAEALEKIEAKVEIFRVGTYKSAVEPLIRNDMSEAAKQANRALLAALWNGYLDDVTAARGLADGTVEDLIEEIVERLDAAGGDLAKLAADAGLVDRLLDRPGMIEAMRQEVGEAENGKAPYNGIGYARYLQATNGAPADANDAEIGVITVRGALVEGEAPPDQAGSDTIVRLIRQARTDDDVKAIVIRVDSPGGSAFASELIRQELAQAQAAGKPVVASFGSVAASGGYWISSSADEIWSLPETVTGSIGIFGLFISLDESLAAIGMNADGVGTTQLSGALDPRRELNDTTRRLLQRLIEHGYEEFLTRVADGRGMTRDAVDAVAQGRVWAGVDAKQLGLVDQLGGLERAAASAAAQAGLKEGEYQVRHIQQPLSQFQRLLNDLGRQAVAWGLVPAPRRPDPVTALARDLSERIETLAWLNDPRGAYALCLTCRIE